MEIEEARQILEDRNIVRGADDPRSLTEIAQHIIDTGSPFLEQTVIVEPVEKRTRYIVDL